jgi:hypothetical protein
MGFRCGTTLDGHWKTGAKARLFRDGYAALKRRSSTVAALYRNG